MICCLYDVNKPIVSRLSVLFNQNTGLLDETLIAHSSTLTKLFW